MKAPRSRLRLILSLSKDEATHARPQDPAAMIARPEDLVHGQGTTVNNDQLRATKAITAFRAAAPGVGGGTTAGSAGGAK